MSAPFLSAGVTTENIEMEVPEKGEIFTHNDDGKIRVFATGMMAEFAEKHGHDCAYMKRVKLPITPEIIEHIKKNMGFEQDRYDRLCEPYLSRPLIAIHWSSMPERGEAVTVIDGNHRTVKLFDMGKTHTEAWIFHEVMWEQFLLNVPENIARERMNGRSGVIEAERERDARNLSD